MENPPQPFRDNTQRFTGRADIYDQYRQRYPTEEVLRRLREWGGLAPDWLVADIGAGTGMLAEVFLENGNQVLAIEPNADMREASERLRGRWPKLKVIDATAEATTLPDASVEMVAAARAFHWFDKDRALAEFRRILKPDGWIALVSLGRARLEQSAAAPNLAEDAARKQAKDFERLLTDFGTDFEYVRSGYRIHDNMQELFGPNVELHQAQVAGLEPLDWTAFRGQIMSLSITPAADHPNFTVFQEELQRHFDTYAEAGIITTPTTCWITAARFARP